jgi:hypothetical protein
MGGVEMFRPSQVNHALLFVFPQHRAWEDLFRAGKDKALVTLKKLHPACWFRLLM